MDLVTGGLGFIGNELVRQLKSAGRNVAVLDNRHRMAPRIEDIADIPVYEADITDHDRVKAILDEVLPKRVFHLAALHYIPECNALPERTTRVNVEGTLGLLRCSIDAGVNHFLFASSGAVYADSPDAVDESSAAAPVDVYGWSKLFGEQLCRWQSESSGLPVTICRLFNNYGPRETNAHIIPEILSQLRRGDDVTLGNTSTIRDYVYTADTAQALDRLADNPSGGCRVVNIAGGQSATVEELVALIGDILGRRIRITRDQSRFRKADKQVQKSSIDLLEHVTGWRPDRTLRDGLTRLLQFEGLLA